MIAAIVQARMGSTRLPGKVLADIVGHPLLSHVLDRVAAVPAIDRIVVATTASDADAPLRDFLQARRVEMVLGSEDDVLDRYYQAARACGADVIVRVTPDDPFKDPDVIGRAVRLLQEGAPSLDFVANCSYDGSIRATYPEGLDIEVFSFACLERMWTRATRPSEREHVTPYLFNHPDEFRVLGFEHDRDLSHLRWTIDYQRDLDFARAIYDRLYRRKPMFVMRDILAVLDAEPALAEMNKGVQYHEGYLRTVATEKGSTT